MTRASVLLALLFACRSDPAANDADASVEPAGAPLPLALSAEAAANVRLLFSEGGAGARLNVQYAGTASAGYVLVDTTLAGERYLDPELRELPVRSDEAIRFFPLSGRDGVLVRETSSPLAADHGARLEHEGQLDLLRLVCGHVKNEQTSWSKDRSLLAIMRLGCSASCGGAAGGVAVLKRFSLADQPAVLEDSCLAQPPGPSDPAFACAIEPDLHPHGALVVWGCQNANGEPAGKLIVGDFSSGTVVRAGELATPETESFVFVPDREALLINRGDSSRPWTMRPPRGDEAGDIARVDFGGDSPVTTPLEGLSRYVVTLHALTRLGEGHSALHADLQPRLHAAFGGRSALLILDERLHPLGWVPLTEGWDALAFAGGRYYAARKSSCPDGVCFEANVLTLRTLPDP